MKCENCNKEATFFYNSFVNGKITHHHYCADCAREAGYAGTLDFQPEQLLNETEKLFPAFPALPELPELPELLSEENPMFDFLAPIRNMMRAFDSLSESFGAMLKATMPQARFGWSFQPLMLGQKKDENEPEQAEAPEAENVEVPENQPVEAPEAVAVEPEQTEEA